MGAEAGVGADVAVVEAVVQRVPVEDFPLQEERRVRPVPNRALDRLRQVRLVHLLQARALGRAKAALRQPRLAQQAAPPTQKPQPALVARRRKVPWPDSARRTEKERRPSLPGIVQLLVS